MNISFIIVILSLFLWKLNAERENNDDMCKAKRDILCVKDVLMIIAKMAKSIEQTVNQTEKHIANKLVVVEVINLYIKFQVYAINTQLPEPKYHAQFFRVNNINKKYLLHLLLEAHDAISFYYKAINDILNTSDASSTSDWLKKIKDNLRYQIICEYRNVLYVYSHNWTPIDKIKRLKFSTISYSIPPTLLNEAHSMITIGLLKVWMERIHSVIYNLEMKYR